MRELDETLYETSCIVPYLSPMNVERSIPYIWTGNAPISHFWLPDCQTAFAEAETDGRSGEDLRALT